MHTEDVDYLKRVLQSLMQKTGVNFLEYKYTTLQRRVMRRIHILGLDGIPAYWEYMQLHEAEQHLLFKSILIHVSSFFRDEKSFEYLCAEIIPEILKNKQSTETVRVWVCGCSTGEEAYSIAICLHEHAELVGNLARIKIFASDLSEAAIAKARTGIYSKSAIESMSQKRQQTYFMPCRDGFKIKPFLREMCVFTVHNVLADPPFPQIDLLSCRNVLIYMQPILQKKVLTTFSYALKVNGYLFLGKSETSGLAGKFETVNKAANIFINKMKNASLGERHQTGRQRSSSLNSDYSVPIMEKKDFQNAADELLMAKYMPSGVVVNDSFDIVDFKGNTGFYIEPSPGIASFNVLKMVRKGLYYDLNEALNKVRTERTAIKKENIALEHEGKLLRITIEVLPLSAVGGKYYLVLFHTIVLPTEAHLANDGINDTRDLRILQLEQELLQSREQLRALSEEQEATNEEFQSANEELRTLNEELQTSQEEIISINEELLIRNKELVEVNKELNYTKQLSESINNTVSDCLLVLTQDLRIKQANASFYETFDVLPHESEGKYLYELSNGQWNFPQLRKLLEEVLLNKSAFSDYILRHEFEAIGERILKLSSRRIKSDSRLEPLILLAITDVTQLVQVQEQVLQSQQLIAINEERQRLAMDATNYGIWDYELNTDKLYLSKEARDILNISTSSVNGWTSLLDTVHQEDRARVEQEISQAMEGTHPAFFSEEYRISSASEPGVRWISTNGKAIFDETNQLKRLTGIVADITEKKDAETKLKEALTRLDLALHAGYIGSWELNLKTRELVTSDQCKANFGLPPHADFTFDDFINSFFEEDRTRVRKAVEAAIVSRQSLSAEYQIRWPDESIHWIEASGLIKYDENGEAISMVGVATDITEKKDINLKLAYSEHHFKTLANSSPVMVGMCDSSMHFYFFNHQWQNFLGTTEASLGNSDWSQFIHPEDVAMFEETQAEALKRHNRFSLDMRLRSHGSYRWVTCIAEPRFGEDNTFTGYTMACTDIQDQRAALDELERKVEERTEALRDLNEDLLDRNHELKKFAYVTSHDLQEPLRKIKMFVSMLLSKETDDNTYLTDQLHKIEFSATRMIGLIHDLLNYSSVQDRHLSYISVDLDKTIHHVLSDFDLLIQEKKAVFTIGNLPVIDAVPLQMNQLFYNLISNSLKFVTPGTAPRITIQSSYVSLQEKETLQLDSSQPFVKISVSDNGIGFDPSFSDRIFEIFQRLHTRESYQGNGIGLALCKRIVTNHGGLIIPYSEPNQGTTFEIILPEMQP